MLEQTGGGLALFVAAEERGADGRVLGDDRLEREGEGELFAGAGPVSGFVVRHVDLALRFTAYGSACIRRITLKRRAPGRAGRRGGNAIK